MLCLVLARLFDGEILTGERDGKDHVLYKRARVEEKEGHIRRRIESIIYLGVVQATIVGVVDVDLQRVRGVGDKEPGSGSRDDLLLVRFGVKPQTEL